MIFWIYIIKNNNNIYIIFLKYIIYIIYYIIKKYGGMEQR